MDHQTHFFFAVSIPVETKVIMKKYLEQLNKRIPFSRWVHYEDLHITLAFLGSAPTEKIKMAEKNVKEIVRGSKPLKLQIQKLGIFGKEDSPRIFFADTVESNELQELRTKVFSACVDAGFKLETRPFRSHITIARKWKGNEPFQTKFLEIWNELQLEPLVFEATNIVLFQTHLNETPKYEAKSIILLE
ncbi:RNA 2',3'-cyclic phosphodiesterase [Neobacillus sp. PS3-40]|uniref:RNA 2',3'-cyclic phosphodiesterase n=1 Tax=Neobacillus sp. PS3-40 TaxID=3070679 RepID=UPI0027E17E53|nr:RNA 2',3'-cyclic phosphodiesterase [Neobacillus sp. PS3-40]WML45699.1 RNA 2',3'-cyclic phosphodiesterase [Neobacillus sp. PS3-40]